MPPDTPATLSLCECCWTSQDVIFHEVHFLGLTGGKKKSEILLHWKKYVLFFRTYCFSEINYEQSYNIKQKICLVWLNIFWRTTNTDLYSYINNSYVNVMRKKILLVHQEDWWIYWKTWIYFFLGSKFY